MPNRFRPAPDTRALLFLASRTFVNGIKRSISNPRRLIGVVFFCAYWIFAVMRPLTQLIMRAPAVTSPIQFTPAQIEPVLTMVFIGVSAFLSLGILGYRNTFRPPDVDVLFATPVRPRAVLIGRILRDYLFTLILPLTIGLLTGVGSPQVVGTLMRNVSAHAHLLTRTVIAAWFLLSLAWVSIGYAASLFSFRSDARSERYRYLILAPVLGPIAAIFVQAMMAVRNHQPVTDLANQLWVQIAFFPAWGASRLAIAPLTGDLASGILGFTLLAGAIALGFGGALRQLDWMYDQAASRGLQGDTMRELRRRSDMVAMLSERARAGKVKNRMAGVFRRWTPRGGMAILWREAILQVRGGIWMHLALGLFYAGMQGYFAWEAKSGTLSSAPALFLFMQGMLIFSSGMMGAQTGYMELLRRVDLQKPLPFTPTRTAFWEVVGKSIPTVAIAWISSVVVLAVNPAMLPYALCAFLIAPTASTLISAVVLLVTIWLPDLDDPAQRGFRGLLSFFSIALSAAPAIVLVAGLTLAGVPIAGAGVAVLIVNAAMTYMVCLLAGRAYAAFNPSE